MGCTPKMNGGGEADFAEQSAERTNKRRNIAVSEAKRGKHTRKEVWVWAKELHIAQAEETAPVADAKRGLSVVMESAKDTKHGTRSGKRRSWRDSEGQAYCMKRIRERVQR